MSTIIKTILLRVARYLIVFLIVHSVVLETASDWLGAKRSPRTHAGSPFLNTAVWYQKLLNPYRKPYSRFVRIVELDPRRLPDRVSNDVCTRRRFMAALVSRLAEAKPAAIVVDAYFPEDACTDPDANRALREAFRHVGIPVVLGLATSTADSGTKNRLLAPNFDFGPVQNIKYGLTELSSDIRRIPLEWTVFNDHGDSTIRQYSRTPTLSLVAAQTIDDHVRSEMMRFIQSDTSPYILSLITSGIPTYSAADFLCSTNISYSYEWGNCHSLSRSLSDDLRGHVVVIGIIGDDSVINGISGVVLQANYIEAILDDRLIAPIQPSIAFLANFVLALLLTWGFFKLSVKSRLLVGVSLVPFVVIIPWLLSYLLITLFGYYFAVWGPVGALVGLWLGKHYRKANPTN